VIKISSFMFSQMESTKECGIHRRPGLFQIRRIVSPGEHTGIAPTGDFDFFITEEQSVI